MLNFIARVGRSRLVTSVLRVCSVSLPILRVVVKVLRAYILLMVVVVVTIRGPLPQALKRGTCLLATAVTILVWLLNVVSGRFLLTSPVRYIRLGAMFSVRDVLLHFVARLAPILLKTSNMLVVLYVVCIVVRQFLLGMMTETPLRIGLTNMVVILLLRVLSSVRN